MHTGPMKESEGVFRHPQATNCQCRKCKGGPVVYEIWDSSCGGYEDYKYTCKECNYTWWVDGIDS